MTEDHVIQMQIVLFPFISGTSVVRSCCSLKRAVDLHFMVFGQRKGKLVVPEVFGCAQ